MKKLFYILTIYIVLSSSNQVYSKINGAKNVRHKRGGAYIINETPYELNVYIPPQKNRLLKIKAWKWEHYDSFKDIEDVFYVAKKNGEFVQVQKKTKKLDLSRHPDQCRIIKVMLKNNIDIKKRDSKPLEFSYYKKSNS